MNETLKVFEERRSIRKFKPDMVEKDKIDAIIKAGMYAPSGHGKQSAIILAISDEKVRNEIMEENRKIGGFPEGVDPFYGAPVILVVLADTSVETYLYDGSLVLGNMLNAAESLGLGSIWIHRCKEEFLGSVGKDLLNNLGIKGEYEGIGHCAIGYIDGDKPQANPRKDNYVYYI